MSSCVRLSAQNVYLSQVVFTNMLKMHVANMTGWHIKMLIKELGYNRDVPRTGHSKRSLSNVQFNTFIKH